MSGGYSGLSCARGVRIGEPYQGSVAMSNQASRSLLLKSSLVLSVHITDHCWWHPGFRFTPRVASKVRYKYTATESFKKWGALKLCISILHYILSRLAAGGRSTWGAWTFCRPWPRAVMRCSRMSHPWRRGCSSTAPRNARSPSSPASSRPASSRPALCMFCFIAVRHDSMKN